jgi:hypothetical protein
VTIAVVIFSERFLLVRVPHHVRIFLQGKSNVKSGLHPEKGWQDTFG